MKKIKNIWKIIFESNFLLFLFIYLAIGGIASLTPIFDASNQNHIVIIAFLSIIVFASIDVISSLIKKK